MKKIKFILKKIKKASQKGIENQNLFEGYIEESISKRKLITFYNWECPPRVLDVDKKGRVFVNYCVDVEKVFRGEKFDKYTELPRVAEEQKKEKRALAFLMSLGLHFRFVKIIADTNVYHLTPESLGILGEENIKGKFLVFKREIEMMVEKNYEIRPRVYFFTDLIKDYKKEYEEALDESLRILNRDVRDLVSFKTWQEQLQFTKEHMGFKKLQQKEIMDFARRTIATYAAEGIVFNLLSGTKDFSNCVWLNIEEISDRAIEITNCLRVKKGIGKLPMIFPK